MSAGYLRYGIWREHSQYRMTGEKYLLQMINGIVSGSDAVSCFLQLPVFLHPLWKGLTDSYWTLLDISLGQIHLIHLNLNRCKKGHDLFKSSSTRGLAAYFDTCLNCQVCRGEKTKSQLFFSLYWNALRLNISDLTKIFKYINLHHSCLHWYYH